MAQRPPGRDALSSGLPRSIERWQGEGDGAFEYQETTAVISTKSICSKPQSPCRKDAPTDSVSLCREAGTGAWEAAKPHHKPSGRLLRSKYFGDGLHHSASLASAPCSPSTEQGRAFSRGG